MTCSSNLKQTYSYKLIFSYAAKYIYIEDQEFIEKGLFLMMWMKSILKKNIFFHLGSYSNVLGYYSWIHSQGLQITGLGVSYVVSGFKFKLAACK